MERGRLDDDVYLPLFSMHFQDAILCSYISLRLK